MLQQVKTLMLPKCEQQKTQWEWQLSEGNFEVNVDVQQMEHVLVNIVQNALEAIEAGGSIRISTGINPVKELRISNNGRKIPKAIQQKLFAPFFSTKKDGQGIGLTLIREILLNHGFRFSLQTLNDGWTEFRIEFDQDTFPSENR